MIERQVAELELRPTLEREGARVANEGRGAPRALRKQLTIVTLILSDVLLAFLVSEGALVVQGVWGRGSLSEVTALASIVSMVALWVGLRALLGLYPGYGLSSVEELRRQTHAVLATLAATAIFVVAFHIGDLMSRLLLFVSCLGLAILAPPVRYLVKRALFRMGVWGKPVAIMGFGEPGESLVRLLKKEWQLGYEPVAIFDNSKAPISGEFEGVPYGGTLTDAMLSGLEREVDTAIFAMPYTRRERVAKYVRFTSSRFRYVLVIPNLSGVANSAVVAKDLAGTFSVEIRYNLLNPWALRVKRVLDIAASVLIGVLVLPIILVLCLLVWLESGRPVLYSDWRTGQNGKVFSCVKFRTMVPNAEGLLERMLDENLEMREEYRKYHKLRDDPRVTHIGRWLRKTSLDELPQLWNVLRGEMSLVGPRPYLPRESEDIGKTQGEILRVPPGITGPWQVNGRNHTSFAERVEMDAHYVQDWSIWLDLVLLAHTVKCVVLDKAAY